MQERFRVEFHGTMVDGYTQEEAILALSKAYERPQESFSSWFSGEPVILRAEATYDEAEEIRHFFHSLGMVVEIHEIATREEPQVEERSAADEERETLNRLEKATTPEEAKQLLIELIEQSRRQNSSLQVELFKPASLFKRFLALVIDFILLAFLSSLIIQLFLIPMGIIDPLFIEFTQYLVTDIEQSNYFGGELPERFQSLDLQREMSRMMIATSVITILYFTLLEGGRGAASLGKRLFRLHLYSAGGGRVTYLQGFMRILLLSIAFNVTGLIDQILPGLGTLILFGTLFMAQFDRSGLRRTFYDRYTKTAVGERSK